MRMRGKPGILKKNLVLVPLMIFMLMLTAADVMQSSSQLLSDPNSYALSPSEASTVNTNSMTYASAGTVFVLLGSGLIFDILGRRWTVSIMFLTGAAATVPFPFGKDLGPGRIWFFNFFKVVYNCTVMALLMNPFINDYVKVQDRGIAMGVQNTGLVFGTLTSVGVLYTLTSRLAYDVAFPLLAVLQIVWVVIILGGGLI